MLQPAVPLSPTPLVSEIEEFFTDPKKKYRQHWYKYPLPSKWVMRGYKGLLFLIETCEVKEWKMRVFRLTIFLGERQQRIDFKSKYDAMNYAQWLSLSILDRYVEFNARLSEFRVVSGNGNYV